MVPEEIYQKAIKLFEQFRYEDSVEILTKLYNAGYLKTQIKEFLYSSFVNP